MQQMPYSLAAVLTQREQDRDRARARLKQERALLAQRGRELAELTAALSASGRARQVGTLQRTGTGAELARSGALACRQAMEHARLVSLEAAAARAHAAQSRAAHAAEAALAAMTAEHAVIERHYAQFQQSLARQAQHARDDEQDDLLSARSHARATR